VTSNNGREDQVWMDAKGVVMEYPTRVAESQNFGASLSTMA